jgi:murein DD-endopeptidase MepM/ murein hydrolase activator NlpD
MRLPKGQGFLFRPASDAAGHGRPRWTVLVAGGAVTACILLLVLFVGAAYRGEAARLRAENAGLRQQIDRLEQRLALLRADLDAAYHLQETVATAVGVTPLDPTVREAGVGGREAPAMPPLPGLGAADGSRVAALDHGIDKLVRQARLQTQGYQTILDTLQARAAVRSRIPSIRPVESGWLSSGFGVRMDPFTGKPTLHEGLDFSVGVGTPVHATADGVVGEVVFERGFGHCIVVQHDARTATRYAHLARTLVQRGARVRRGDVIAYSGASGRVTSPHLHYEVLVGGRAVNPLPFILEPYAWRR